ncbi:Ldh family oxidoreductase [Microbacterium sp. A94]|uniref:Ldh family oxidoreductase n=1 Tax=Microbacterium sp. A94 TaxID=3450717 RepID=UPI003F42C958
MSQAENRTIAVADAEEAAVDILMKLGTPADRAAEVAHSLVLAQIVGHDSHGLVRLREYSSFVDRGLVVPDAEPEVISSRGAAIMIDGHHGWGQVASHAAVVAGVKRARELGVAVVTVRNCNHVGRIGEYVDQIAEQGLVGMMWCNSDPCVAPFGGAERMLGTNPFAVSVPTANEPVIVDFATASVAEGKLRVARAAEVEVAPGSVVDKDGQPSTNPNDFYNGGALLPFGAHKGYGLSLAIELLGGALSGGHPSVNESYVSGNGVVLIVVAPDFFVGSEAFLADTTEATEVITASTPSTPGGKVLLPGDVERAHAAKNVDQITMSSAIWDDVSAILAER